MSAKIRLCLIFVIAIILSFPLQGQGGLRIGLGAGTSLPQGTFKREFNFANNGMNFNIDADYSFGVIGFGLSGGIATNDSESTFLQYANKQYTYRNHSISANNWVGKYLAVGPSLQLSYRNFGIDTYGKIGFINIGVPNIYYNVEYFDQRYTAMKYWGDVDDILGMWIGGLKAHYNLTNNLSFQLKGELLTTKFFPGIKNSMTYQDVSDANKNGFIDDVEFFESSEMTISNDVIYSNLNLSAGVLIRVGQPVTKKQDEFYDYSIEEPFLPNDTLVFVEDFGLDQLENIEVRDSMFSNPSDVANFNDEISNPTIDNSSADEYLFIAGKKYLENNELKKALFCFENLINKSDFETAGFYKAITLLKMDKCKEGIAAFNIYKNTYPELLKATDEILFETVLDICQKANKENESLVESNLINLVENEINDIGEEETLPIPTEESKVKPTPTVNIEIPNASIGKDISELEDNKDNIQLSTEPILDIDLKSDPIAVGPDYPTLVQNITDAVVQKEIKDSKIIGEAKTEIKTTSPVISTAIDTNKVLVQLPVESINPNEETENLTYRVQFVALRNGNKRFRKVENIATVETEYFEELKRYRYMTSSHSNVDDAKKEMEKIRKVGFPDAFIAMYNKGERIVTFYHPE
jgi:hypothetical protein